MSHMPGVKEERGDFVAGEVIACVPLVAQFASDGRGKVGRYVTDIDADAVAREMNQRLADLRQDPDRRHYLGRFQNHQLEFRPVPAYHDWTHARSGTDDFSAVLRRAGHAGAGHGHACALVRLELHGKLDRNDQDNIRDNQGHIAKDKLDHYDVVQGIVKAMNRLGSYPVGADDQAVGNVNLVMPNWIMTSAGSHGSGGGGGGPGAPPIAIRTEDLEGLAAMAEPSPFAWPFHVHFKRDGEAHPAEQEVEGSNRGKNVIVLVLDAAPPRERIHAFNEQNQQREIPNALFQSLHGVLFRNDGIERVREVGDIPVAPATEPTGGGRPYQMTDHGLFVAGLIHDIAPEAEIRLWRVLNEWGAGDLGTIFRALGEAFALAEQEQKWVVINLSLVINMPVEEDLNKEWTSADAAAFQGRFDDELKDALGDILATQCVAVAAAGNSSGGPEAPLEPRYPARFDTVIAVAATDGDGKPASYADKGEMGGSAPNGVATFGGDADQGRGGPTIKKKRGSGIPDAPIGLLISQRQLNVTGDRAEETGALNETGWAFWAGSSFATPIITGLAACILSGKKNGTAVPAAFPIIDTIRALATEVGPEADLLVRGIPARQLDPSKGPVSADRG